MEEEYFSADRLLELPVGSVVHVNSEDGSLDYTASFVGAELNYSLITTLPLKQNMPANFDYEKAFTAGLVLEMKSIQNGRIVAFESIVTGMYGGRLLMGSFPEMIETRRLRKDTRFPCTLSCDIRMGGREIYGVIANISNGGCLFNVNKNSDYHIIEESLNSSKAVEMEIFFPAYERPIILDAYVKSASCQLDGACKVGLAFTKEYECIRRYLESLQLDSVKPFFS